MDSTTFKEITAPLKAVSGIRWVDFDLGQLEQEAPPVSYPCILIRLGGGPTLVNGANLDQVELNFTIRVAFLLYERTHSVNSDTYRDAALAHLDKLKDIHSALNGLSGTSFNAITRTQYWTTEGRSDIRVYQASYGTLLEDDGTDSGGGGGDIYVPWADLTDASPDLCLDNEVEGYDSVDQPEKVIPVD